MLFVEYELYVFYTYDTHHNYRAGVICVGQFGVNNDKTEGGK